MIKLFTAFVLIFSTLALPATAKPVHKNFLGTMNPVQADLHKNPNSQMNFKSDYVVLDNASDYNFTIKNKDYKYGEKKSSITVSISGLSRCKAFANRIGGKISDLESRHSLILRNGSKEITSRSTVTIKSPSRQDSSCEYGMLANYNLGDKMTIKPNYGSFSFLTRLGGMSVDDTRQTRGYIADINTVKNFKK